MTKFFGDLGDGKPYFIASLLLVTTGHHYEFNCFILTFLFSLIINHVLKLMIMHPRPYFLNQYLTIEEVLDCSAEFGNPSGHSVMAACVFFHIRKTFYKGSGLNLIFTLFMMFAIGFSRVFGGMHTVD
jgi:membrane-associated phospholipid phosphatase